MVGALYFLASATLRPLGPRVERTARATTSTPADSSWRASSASTICLGMVSFRAHRAGYLRVGYGHQGTHSAAALGFRPILGVDRRRINATSCRGLRRRTLAALEYGPMALAQWFNGRGRMRLIIAGCEYSGTTTLANAIGEWAEQTLGGRPGIHDHFKGPPEKGLTAEEEAQFAALGPRPHEMFQRYQIEYHLQPGFFAYPDHVLGGHASRGCGLRPALLRLRRQGAICRAHGIRAPHGGANSRPCAGCD